MKKKKVFIFLTNWKDIPLELQFVLTKPCRYLAINKNTKCSYTNQLIFKKNRKKNFIIIRLCDRLLLIFYVVKHLGYDNAI